MKFTIHRRQETICASCRNGQTIETDRSTITLCHLGGMEPRRILVPVRRCSDYDAINAMTRYEADKIGWVLEQRKGQIGFKPPKVDA